MVFRIGLPSIFLICAMFSAALFSTAVLSPAVFSSSAAAQRVEPSLSEAIEDRNEQLSAIAETLDRPDANIDLVLTELRELRRQIEDGITPLEDTLQRIEQDLERLGAPPENGDASEPASVTSERNRLKEEQSLYSGYLSQARLNRIEAERLIDTLNDQRRSRFSRRLFTANSTPLLPSFWQNGITHVSALGAAFFSDTQKWTYERVEENHHLLLMVGAIVAFISYLGGTFWLRPYLQRRILNETQAMSALPARKVLLAGLMACCHALPVALAFAVLGEVLLLTSPSQSDVQVFWMVCLFVVGGVLGSNVLRHLVREAPSNWRVWTLPAPHRRQVVVIGGGAIWITVGGVILRNGGLNLSTFEQADPFLKFVETVIVGLCLFVSARSYRKGRRIILDDEEAAKIQEAERTHTVMAPPSVTGAEQAQRTDHKFRIPRTLQILALIGLLVTLPGHINLGHYLTTKSVLLLMAVGSVWFLRAALREITRLFDRGFSSLGDKREDHDTLTYFWISLIIDIVALLILIPPAMMILGGSWADVKDLLISTLFGFQIGGIRISLIDISIAIILFTAIVTATRIFQKATIARFFPPNRTDEGLRNSTRTLIGYLGLVIAAAVAIGALGFDLSNLAIIAGALSVGIGFGLQSIVNNFVSGLILLFERPIKAGDWIVTSSGEGTVKQISVRSTEIETFDRASVIVPNSELISGAVTNWTHKNKTGRIIIPVGVSYDADPDRVMEILLAAAHDHDSILPYPAPMVYFEDFADSALNFQLRAFVPDIGSSLSIRTRLRIDILRRLNDAGISIPFPQRDIHIFLPEQKELSAQDIVGTP